MNPVSCASWLLGLRIDDSGDMWRKNRLRNTGFDDRARSAIPMAQRRSKTKVTKKKSYENID